MKMEEKRMDEVRIDIEQLEQLVQRLKRETEHGSMKPYVFITEGKHPNGRKYIQFEQPCYYAECNSNYLTFDTLK
jgi:1-aminocyclopropane-1-carboxylate deaminase/D-cysteine desulfhydrase-like pyridoxal-dependent ACC family enzyme